MTMKVVVLGATGMLGHKILQVLSKYFDVTGTVRKELQYFSVPKPLENLKIIGTVNASDFKSVEQALKKTSPDVIINSVGIIKQLPEAHDPIVSISINSLFPHLLEQYCANKDIRLIHYSTDCVFSGTNGNYTEEDIPDAIDLYGRSKLLGELIGKNCLTLRTSIIGRELSSSHGLIEWFLSKKGKTVKGYKNAVFSGLTTNAHATILKEIILNYPDLEGLFHLAAEPISKYDLLCLVKNLYNLDVSIEPEYREVSNRSLNGSKFKSATKIIIPCWSEMIKDMYKDPTPYDLFR